MVAQSYNVNIEGYWREKNKHGIPTHSGVYFVYETFYNQSTDSISLLRLLFIGKAENVHDYLTNSKEVTSCQEYVNAGNELSFSTGFAENSNLDRLEAAYVYRHKPPCNTDIKESFPFDQTSVFSTGKTALLDTHFTIS